MNIHYEGGGVTVLHGDCIEQMRTLPDASVDAVVTDPPYGLEFMGKAWDSFGRGEAASEAAAGMGKTGYTDGGVRLERPSFLGGLNPRCKTCGRSQRGGSPCRCDVPDFTDERGPRLRAFQIWCEEWARECYRVLKPGGHLLAFGGSRTWHRLAVGIEEAGFELRDSIAWLYGSGFPKSLDVSKAIDKAAGARRPTYERPAFGGTFSDDGGTTYGTAIDGTPITDEARQWQGWGTALKPAFEPVVVARKPLAGTVAANVLAHGTGALNIDATRIAGPKPDTTRGASSKRSSMAGGELGAQGRVEDDGRGRWPTNVLLDESQAVALDEQSGTLTSGMMRAGQQKAGKPAGILGEFKPQPSLNDTYGDSGGASRFFPTFEMSDADWLHELAVRNLPAFRYEAKASTSERPSVGDVQHPTVKPLDLMRWLVRLVTPPGGTVLEPFAGSGTTVEACLREEFSCIAIEREADYLPLIMSRIQKDHEQSLFGDWDGAA